MGIASGLSLASTGLSAIGSISQGQTAASNARKQGMSDFMSAIYNSEQAQLAAEVGDLKATQTDTYMRNRMGGAMANIDVVLANTGQQDSSPSAWAVKNKFEADSDYARSMQNWNTRMQSQADRNASMLYMMSGMNAMDAANKNASALETNGFLGAAGGVLKGLSGLNFG